MLSSWRRVSYNNDNGNISIKLRVYGNEMDPDATMDLLMRRTAEDIILREEAE